MSIFQRGSGVYRSNDGIFLGVCAGIAERFDFSPWGLRLLMIGLQVTIFHWMILLYLVLALCMRRDPLTRRQRRRARWDF